MALSEMVNRLSVLEGPNEGDASLALGRAGVADARDCGSVITPALPYFGSYRNATQPELFGLSGLKASRRSRISLLLAQEQQPKRVAFGRRYLVCGGEGRHVTLVIFTTPSYSFQTAQESGVWRLSSGLSGLTSSRASSSFTTPSCPFLAAHGRGVLVVILLWSFWIEIC